MHITDNTRNISNKTLSFHFQLTILKLLLDAECATRRIIAKYPDTNLSYSSSIILGAATLIAADMKGVTSLVGRLQLAVLVFGCIYPGRKHALMPSFQERKMVLPVV